MIHKKQLLKNTFYILFFVASFGMHAYADTKLYINTNPKNSVIKILNIKPKFSQGISLKEGKYIISVYHRKYVKKKFELQISKERKLTLKVLLFPKRFTNSIGMEFVYIKPGTFMMGSPKNEIGRILSEPQFKITLTKGFYMQATEVSEGQFKKIMNFIPSEFPLGKDFPVENVSWNDANKFINKLNVMETVNNYRLPTEAEWEYACRAGTTTPFYFGNCINSNQVIFDGYESYGNCRKSGMKYKHPVKSLKPNKWGLYHMHGNVREFCLDYWGVPKTIENERKTPDYELFIPFKKHQVDYINKIKSRFRVVKGGSWNYGAAGCRSASRSRITMDSTYSSLGFRVVKMMLTKDYEIIK